MVSESRSKENHSPPGGASGHPVRGHQRARTQQSRASKALGALPKRIGNFEIKSVIASGGMGMVYHGHHAFLGKPAAIKVLRPDLPRRRELVEMLRGEAQALARVDHPNVVQVIDIGQHEGTDFIAMDFAPGMDLRRWLTRNGPFEPRVVLLIAWQMMSGIAAAHLQGVLHRDIKPDNIILARDGTLKITDFGLAGDIRMVAAGHQKQSHATPAYAAPEVLKGWRSDRRSDVFSIAATIYQAATGLLPFGSASRTSVLEAQRKGVQSLHELVPGLPRAFCDAVMAALSVEDVDRPADAAEFMRLAFPQGVPGVARARRRWWIGVSVAVVVAVTTLLVSRPWGASLGAEPGALPVPTQDGTREPEPESQGQAVSSQETSGISKLVQAARERRARAAWTAFVETLGTERIGRLDEATMHEIASFARAYDGTESAAEARELLARGFPAIVSALSAALESASTAESAAAVAALVESVEALAGRVGYAPDAAWRDAVSKLLADATSRDIAYLAEAQAEAEQLQNERRFFDAIERLHALRVHPAYSSATDEVRVAIQRRIEYAEASARAVMGEGEAMAIAARAESFRSRTAWAATTLNALELSFRSTSAANPAHHDVELRKRMGDAPAPDRFAFLSTLAMLRRATESLEWLATRLEARKGETLTLLLVGRDGAVAKRETVGILGRSGLFLEVSGLGGLPRAELPVWELDAENWRSEIERLPFESRVDPITLFANLLTFRRDHGAAKALASLLPADASDICHWRSPIEPITTHLKTISALATSSVSNQMPPRDFLPASHQRFVEAHVAFVADYRADGSSPVVAAASFAHAMRDAPSAYFDPRILPQMLELLPSSAYLARALLDHVPTDPAALKHLFASVGEDQLPSERREEWRAALLAAAETHRGDRELWELARKLKAK